MLLERKSNFPLNSKPCFSHCEIFVVA
jgi:hypothetical protein